jgi:hypothetical protein
MNSSKNITKKVLADKLIEKLIFQHHQEAESISNDLKIDLNELMQKNLSNTERSPSYRYMQGEEIRINRILSVANHIRQVVNGKF